MVDWTSMAIVVVLGYVAIKYGPQIAQGLQNTAGAAPAPVDTTAATAPPAAPAPPTPLDQATAAALQPASVVFGTGITPGSAPPTPCGKGLIADFFGRCVSPTTNTCGSGTHFNDVTGRCEKDSTPQPRTLVPPTGAPKLTHQKCVPGTGPGTGQPCLPISTRAKTPTPPHAAPKFKCLCPSGGGFYKDGYPGANCPTKGEICTASSNVGYYQAYSIPDMGPQWYKTTREYQASMTQIVTDPKTGKTSKITTIDPYMPSGFLLGSANDRSSREPAIH